MVLLDGYTCNAPMNMVRNSVSEILLRAKACCSFSLVEESLQCITS